MTRTAVAIVDRQPVLCESLAAYLASEPDLRVVGSASTATQVADLVAASRPDVLVLDAELDEMDGAKIFSELRGVASYPAIVMLTCDQTSRGASSAIRMGVTGLVLKVAPAKELVDAVRLAAKGQMWVSPPLLTILLSRQLDASSAEAAGRLATLTPRELEVLELLVEGLDLRSIAGRLHVSANTVRTHSQNLQKKLGVHSALAAVALALDAGLRPDRNRDLD